MRHLLVAGLKSASASVLLAACSVASAKVLAVVLGPAGVGAFSLMKQLLMTATVIASLNPQTALAHAVGRGQPQGALGLQLSSVFWTVAVWAALVAGAGLLLAGPLADALLPGVAREGVIFALMAAALLVNVLFVVLLCTLQALRRAGAAAVAQVAGGVATVVLAYPCAVRAAQGEAAMLAGLLLAGPLVSGGVAAFLGWRDGWLAPALAQCLRLRLSAPVVAEFLRISVAGLAAALAAALSLLAVRAIVAQDLGLEAAGVFDAAWTIGHGGFGMLLAAFGTYYLPTLISAGDARDRGRLVNQAFLLLTLAAAPAIVAGIAFRHEIVALLYSAEFRAADQALFWILGSQYLRLAGWTLSFLALARAQMRYLVIADVAWCVGFVAAALSGMSGPAPLAALGMAYAMLHALYLGFFAVCAWRVEGVRLQRGVLGTWLIGLAVIASTGMLLHG